MWIKKTKILSTNYPHFIYFPMQKSLKISPSKSSGYLIPKNSSKEERINLKSSAATSTFWLLDILSMQDSSNDMAISLLESCIDKISNNQNVDVAAEDLRLIRSSFDEFLGIKYPDDLLGDIFKDFCIGK